VIALCEDLPAVAHALEFAADLLDPVGLLLCEKRQNGEKRDCEKRNDETTDL